MVSSEFSWVKYVFVQQGHIGEHCVSLIYKLLASVQKLKFVNALIVFVAVIEPL